LRNTDPYKHSHALERPSEGKVRKEQELAEQK